MNSIKVLVIDDEKIVLDSVKQILRAENCEVDGTLKSKEGLDWTIQRNYDIILTDIRMPEIGGMRILRDIKRAKPSLPVIIITGYATIQSAVQAMKLGATDYIEKPFLPEDLIKALTAALGVVDTRSVDIQELVHKEEVIRVLERAANDAEFIANLYYHGADALDEYNLTGPEKLAILTGDIPWIEEHIGTLTKVQKRWLERRSSAEIW